MMPDMGANLCRALFCVCRNELGFYLRVKLFMSFEFELVCETLCQMRDLQFFCLRVVALVPEQNPHSRPVKKHIPRIYFFTGPFGGSASVLALAGPQKRFCANCKRVLRAGGMRGLLELLLAISTTPQICATETRETVFDSDALIL